MATKEPKQATEVRRLFTTFGYLVAKQGATAALGLAYWAVVTHLFPARDVGLAAAAASTALLLAAIGALGIPLLLLAEIGPIKSVVRRFIFTTGLAIACFVVLILSIGTVALSPLLGKSLRLIGQDPITAVLFVIGSVATMAGLTLDGAAIGLHRGSAQLWRGILSSLLKLACVGVLVLASTRTGAGLIFAWAFALVVSFFFCFPMLELDRTPVGEGTLSRRAALVRRFGGLSLQHHVLNLSISSISYIVPLMATLLIPPQQVAYFSAAYLLSATVLIIPYLLALSLFAERSGDPGLLHRHVRRTLPLGLALSSGIVARSRSRGALALRIFGPAYAANGTTALRILILVGPAYVIKDHYVSIRRAQGTARPCCEIMAIGTAAEAAGRRSEGSSGAQRDLPRLGRRGHVRGHRSVPAVLQVLRRRPAVESAFGRTTRLTSLCPTQPPVSDIPCDRSCLRRIGPAINRPYRGSMRPTTADAVNGRTRRAPCRPIAAASSGSASNDKSAAASASWSPGGTRLPVIPSSTRSTIPPLAAATTGRPAAMASRTTVGQQSGTIDGTTTTARRPDERYDRGVVQESPQLDPLREGRVVIPRTPCQRARVGAHR